jgi:hypothetical protein
VEILLEGRSHGFLSPLDLNVNCRVRRLDRKHLAVESLARAPVATGQLSFSQREDEP